MEKKTNLSDAISQKLEDMIMQQLKPGDRVPPEMELAKSFGVGRSTIRESLKALTSKGLIVRGKDGTFVSDHVGDCLITPLNLLVNMEIGNVADLLELREVLELGAIRIAAQRSDEESLRELELLNWKMTEPGLKADQIQQLDIQFHNQLAKAGGNPVLTELLNALRQVMMKNLETPEDVMPVLQDSIAMHQNLIECMRSHDEEKAYQMMKTYFSMTKTGLGQFNRE